MNWALQVSNYEWRSSPTLTDARKGCRVIVNSWITRNVTCILRRTLRFNWHGGCFFYFFISFVIRWGTVICKVHITRNCWLRRWMNALINISGWDVWWQKYYDILRCAGNCNQGMSDPTTRVGKEGTIGGRKYWTTKNTCGRTFGTICINQNGRHFPNKGG